MRRIPALLAALSVFLGAGNAHSQPAYPDKPVKIVVGFTPGVARDLAATIQREIPHWAKLIKQAGIKATD